MADRLLLFFNFELSIKYNTLSCKNFIRCFSF